MEIIRQYLLFLFIGIFQGINPAKNPSPLSSPPALIQCECDIYKPCLPTEECITPYPQMPG
jgi:hypothetical protein